jgi:hypothetical protein
MENSPMFSAFRTTYALAALIGVACVPAGPPRAQFIDDQQRQAQCELNAIGNTRSRLAVDWIRTACNRLAIDEGFLLNESNRRFHTCLLRYLSGVQSDSAASQVINSCRTAYPP